MQARDATGRKVSLLNDDAATAMRAPLQRPVSFQSVSHSSQRPLPAPRSFTSSPGTPELLRSDSYDSQMSSNDPMSPITPTVDFSYPRTNQYSLGHEYGVDGLSTKSAPFLSVGSRTTTYADDDDSSATSSAPERASKRYPCRYSSSHGCEKTFTTSGHASRHAKIHTAEKAVQCTYAGCPKKFTRADNMKQHLETHYKDRSRSSGNPRGQKMDARRNSTARSRSAARELSQWETEQYPLPSPTGSNLGAWDMQGLIQSRPTVSRNPSSGLDALAMAVACQEGGRA